MLYCGEIGGDKEYAFADAARSFPKPVVAMVVGRHAPAEKKMGHAGALVGSAREGAAAKLDALAAAGCRIAAGPAEAVAILTELGFAERSDARETASDEFSLAGSDVSVHLDADPERVVSSAALRSRSARATPRACVSIIVMPMTAAFSLMLGSSRTARQFGLEAGDDAPAEGRAARTARTSWSLCIPARRRRSAANPAVPASAAACRHRARGCGHRRACGTASIVLTNRMSMSPA